MTTVVLAIKTAVTRGVQTVVKAVVTAGVHAVVAGPWRLWRR